MAEKRRGGRKESKQSPEIKKTGHRQWTEDYGEGDVKAVLSRGDWRNWNEIIQWLDKKGEQDNELTPGEVIAMREDMQHLREQGASFTSDPSRVFQMMHRFRK